MMKIATNCLYSKPPHLGSVKLRSPQQPLGPGVVVVGVVVGGAGLVGPGEGVGPPPMPGREAIHQRVLDLVLPSS